MSYEIEKTGDLSRVATVTVTAEDFQKQVNRELRELSKQVKLKGFRAGKVPLSVMRQRYGASVQQEVVEKLVNEELNRLVEEEGNVLYLEILEPPDQMEGANEGQIGFKVELELRPEVDPVGYVGIEVERPEPEVHDEELGEQLEALREEYATLEPIALRDTVREGDVVNLDFKALGEGDDFEQLQGDDVNITVGSGEALPGIEEGLIGAKFNASQTITVQLDEDFPMESLRGREVRLEVQINSVKKRVLPALDDEFAVDTGRGQTLLELRGNVRKEISEAKGTYADRLAERDLLDKLLEQHAFRVPPKFLEQQVRQTVDQRLEMLREQGIDPEEMGLDREKLAEDVRDQRERQLRTEFLLMAIAEKEKIELEKEDLQAWFQQESKRYGISGDQFAALVSRDQQQWQQAVGSALLQKTLGWLLENATVKSVEWPEEEDHDHDHDHDHEGSLEAGLDEESSSEVDSLGEESSSSEVDEESEGEEA